MGRYEWESTDVWNRLDEKNPADWLEEWEERGMNKHLQSLVHLPSIRFLSSSFEFCLFLFLFTAEGTSSSQGQEEERRCGGGQMCNIFGLWVLGFVWEGQRRTLD